MIGMRAKFDARDLAARLHIDERELAREVGRQVPDDAVAARFDLVQTNGRWTLGWIFRRGASVLGGAITRAINACVERKNREGSKP